MDGTIIDSTNAIVKHWQKIGKEIGVDPEVILATSHGRRSIEVLEILDPSRANWECESDRPFFARSLSLYSIFVTS